MYWFDVGCRVLARVDTGTVTFVCAELHRDAAVGPSMFWTEDALKEACTECLTAQQSKLASVPSIFSEDAFQSDDEEIHINNLTYPVLANVLLHFDIVAQLWLNRQVPRTHDQALLTSNAE
ncbi:uncharacterized protein LOC129600233 [Paramacrobiotus metropolitanus]|uniref:uncharacterized protein LOC129600233 n=1 Tax=Paramacrobiotus metropolitanus TaxID=2943436 RepID=UPI0024463AF8|nr:uncharacterized protein LOC129600233 [Paramacrobiotus metropolitanus]